VGCIDGMLDWIEKPSLNECEKAKCGQVKFFCGRKKKFGLNLQGVCNRHGRFLNVNAKHPGYTGGYLAFMSLPLKSKLESRPNNQPFLLSGLCLFGDNDYVNTEHVATPYQNVKAGSKDDYNFYHSKTRIKIECAFGMLVNRWGILHRPIANRITLKKAGSLIICLCRLHNYCITE